MALIPDNPILPVPEITVTQAGNTASPIDVAFTINDNELVYQAKAACRQDTHAYVSAYISTSAGFTGGALDKLLNAIVTKLAATVVTK